MNCLKCVSQKEGFVVQSIILKVGSEKANGIMRQAKRAFVEREVARETKQWADNQAMICGLGTAGFTLGALAVGPLASVSLGGAGLTAAKGVSLVLDSLKASKQQKQASKVLNETINKQDFRDVLNRFLRMKGKEGIPDKDALVVPNIDGINLVGVISKDDAKYISILKNMRLCGNPKEEIIVCGSPKQGELMIK